MRDPTDPGTGTGADSGKEAGIEAAIEAGIGAGRRSPEAVARLARGVGDPDLDRPDLSDPDRVDADAVDRWRVAVHRAWGEGPEGDEPAHEPARIAGVDVLFAGPADAPVTVVYAHGGGYVLGSPGVAAPITARLARRVRVVSVDYRLAPRHRFPAALDDVTAVFRSVLADADTPVALAGDSDGGALALGTALRTPGGPSALVLFCPHLDHGPVPDDRNGPVSADLDGAELAALYRAATDPTDGLLSPGRAPAGLLATLPPTLVQTGTADALHRQAVRFARRARVAGAPVTLDVWDGLWHAWQYHRNLPEADRAIAEAVGFLVGRPALPSGTPPRPAPSPT